MKSKKFLMAYAALLIVIFHLYIPMTKSPVETFFYRAAYIGVDIFFLLSGFSVGSRKEFNFKSLILNRLTRIYLPFVAFSVVAAIYQKWKIMRFFKVIFGVEFFTRGGGAFLWFFIGIMLLYLVSPLFAFAKKTHGGYSLLYVTLIWVVLVVLLQYVFNYTTIFILLNRIPIFLIGFYADLIIDKLFANETKWLLPLDIFGLFSGIALVWFFGTNYRLNKPIADCFYLLAIILVLSIAVLSEMICRELMKKAECRDKLNSSENKEIQESRVNQESRERKKLNIFEILGSITLELYALQMIFGYDIEAGLLKMLGKNIFVFPITLLILIIASVFINWTKKAAADTIKKIAAEK